MSTSSKDTAGTTFVRYRDYSAFFMFCPSTGRAVCNVYTRLFETERTGGKKESRKKYTEKPDEDRRGLNTNYDNNTNYYPRARLSRRLVRLENGTKSALHYCRKGSHGNVVTQHSEFIQLLFSVHIPIERTKCIPKWYTRRIPIITAFRPW